MWKTSSDYFISTLEVEVDLELNEFWIMIDVGILDFFSLGS